MDGRERDERYLDELMREFPVSHAPVLQDAIFLIQERYRLLWSIFHSLDADPIRSEVPIDRSDDSFKFYLMEIEDSINFLWKHGLEIRWSEMEGKNNEFIRRLNAVHKHVNSPAPYVGYLTSYVRKFTHEVEALRDATE